LAGSLVYTAICEIPRIGGLVCAAQDIVTNANAVTDRRMNFNPSQVRIKDNPGTSNGAEGSATQARARHQQ
jgi:hypothetical protein